MKDFTGGYALHTINPIEIGDEFEVKDKCIGHGKHNYAVVCYEFYGIPDALFDVRNFAILPSSYTEIKDNEVMSVDEFADILP